jgi:hypothetical protein
MVSAVSPESAVPPARRDWLGIACSGLCVLHCLAPLLLTLAGTSLAGLALFRDESLHRVLLVLVPAVAIWSLAPSLRVHHRRGPFALAGLGVTLLLGAAMLGEVVEKPLSIAGGLFMIAAHVHNRAVLREGSRYGAVQGVQR